MTEAELIKDHCRLIFENEDLVKENKNLNRAINRVLNLVTCRTDCPAREDRTPEIFDCIHKNKGICKQQIRQAVGLKEKVKK